MSIDRGLKSIEPENGNFCTFDKWITMHHPFFSWCIRFPYFMRILIDSLRVAKTYNVARSSFFVIYGWDYGSKCYNPDSYTFTMLQKLSKWEVKAWPCWNLITLLPLRFYAKSNFGKFKQSKNVIFGICRASEFWNFVNLGLENCTQLLKIRIQNL